MVQRQGDRTYSVPFPRLHGSLPLLWHFSRPCALRSHVLAESFLTLSPTLVNYPFAVTKPSIVDTSLQFFLYESIPFNPDSDLLLAGSVSCSPMCSLAPHTGPARSRVWMWGLKAQLTETLLELGRWEVIPLSAVGPESFLLRPHTICPGNSFFQGSQEGVLTLTQLLAHQRTTECLHPVKRGGYILGFFS